MTDAEFREWLARDNEMRCTLVEFDYIKEGADSPVEPEAATLYFCDRKFRDDVTNHPYVDVVKSAPQFSRSLSGDMLGRYTSSVGSLELDNADGGLDFLLNLACDGSMIRFYFGGVAWPVADFKHIFSAIISKVTAPTFDRITVTLKDTGLLLNQSIGGTTTVGGSGPNADRARPLNIGYIHNLQPLVLDETIDGGRYVHSDDGTGGAAVEVRDRGVSVSFDDNGDGTFDLDAPPTQGGPVTCDVLAEPIGSDNVAVSDAMDHLVGTRAGLTALGLYEGAGPTFDVHDGDDYRLGIHLPEARNVIDLLADIIDSGNCFWAVTRLGKFTFGRLRLNDIEEFIADSPPALEAVDIGEDDIEQNTFSIDHGATQYYQFQAFMSRNQHRQTVFATSLTPDEQAVYARAGKYLLQDDSVGTGYANSPQLYHKTLAKSPVIDTLLSEVLSEFDTDSLAQWMETRRAMQLPWIELPAFTTSIYFYQLELGDVVRLTNPRFGADAGVLFQVIGIVIRLTDAKIELRLARRNTIQDVPDSWTRLVSAQDESQRPYEIRRSTIAPIEVVPPIGGTGRVRIGASADGGVSIGLAASRPRIPTNVGFNKIVFNFIGGSERGIGLGQMRFNFTAGGSGEYTDETTFISACSGGGFMQDFGGIASSGGTAAVPSFNPVFDFTFPSPTSGLIADDTYPTPDAPFCYVDMFAPSGYSAYVTFNANLRSWGARFASTLGGLAAIYPIEFYRGATLVYSTEGTSETVIVGDTNLATFSTFFGFAI